MGSKDEVEGRSGFAHLFEHLMFMGTSRLPDSGFDDLMEAHGGWNNAWTSEDATDYYEVGPTNLLQTLLWMEADRMDGLAGAMTQEKLDLQREVVRNERRQSLEDAPYGVLWLEMPQALYPEGHPYAHSVIGSHEDLQAATLGDVVGFFNSWYVPNNASLVVAGDFDPEQVKVWVQQYFGSLEPVELAPRPNPEWVELPQQTEVELTDQVQVPMSMLLWHTPAALQDWDAAFDFVASILGDGRTSRLYRRLIHEDQLALEVDAHQGSQMLQSVFMISVKPSESHTLEEVEAAITEELARLAAEGPTDVELERVRNSMEVSFLEELEPLRECASAMNRYRYLTGQTDFVQQDLARYRAVTGEDVRAAAQKLSEDRRCIMRVRPAEGADDDGEDDDTDELDGEE